jgi:nucleotide-binding universal stress UspA family protein
MIRIQNILVPVDFSDSSKRAVNYGLSLALEFKARVILAHITHFDSTAYEKAKSDLMELIPPDCRDPLTFEIIVKSGDVRSEIMGIVQDKQIDLVIMGTRGRSYFERMLLGSVTDRMLRKLHVPILTVSHLDPEKEIHTPCPVPLQKILYATDLANGSEEGLKFSIRLARSLDATLTVAHVVQFADAAFHGVEAAAFFPDFVNEVRTQAEERLSRLVALVSDGSVPISTVLAEGVPYETVNRLSEQLKADLIIINLQNKSLLERAVLGATAERVIRTATVPVLSLPLPALYAARWIAA